MKRNLLKIVGIFLLIGMIAVVFFPSQFMEANNYFFQPNDISWNGLNIPIPNDFFLIKGKDNSKKRFTLVKPIDRIFIEFSSSGLEFDPDYEKILESNHEIFIKDKKAILGNKCIAFKFKSKEIYEEDYHETIVCKSADFKVNYYGPFSKLDQFENMVDSSLKCNG